MLVSRKLKIAVIVGSTRDDRFGMIPAQWIFSLAKQRSDLDVELVDLKEFDLPLFNEAASNAWAPTKDARAIAWQRKVGEFDGYIVVTAEYNRSITGALKNAFDQAYVEWGNKAVGFMGYGSVGGTRAVEHARNIAVELKMVNTRSGVHLGGSEFAAVSGRKNSMKDVEAAILPSAKDMLDQLTWWANAARTARLAEPATKAS